MKRLWKQNWFFQKLLQDATSNVIVNEVFTHLSYVSRMRFLNNIIYYTTDEVKADELFDLVLSKYGPKTADQMLAACSLKKIKEIINVRNIKFDNRKLLYLHKYKKNYVEELRKVNKWGKVFDFYDFNAKALGVLGGSDFDLFFSIFEQNDCPRVGKRLTRRILKARREFVLSNASDVHKMLHRRTLLKELKLDFKKFFFHTWPTSFKDFHIYSCFRSMKYYPKGKYLDLLQEGLQEVYGKTISNHPELISDELLEYTSDIEKRRALLEIKMKYNQNEYTLPQYYGTEESIPILKKKLILLMELELEKIFSRL
ncbi:hypothetical protein HHI36_011584 [Cryptolaemus montrouzieri]|uniref:Uncharacterized protein n=1 Tax=Cryptolaemus montrouzieri TaxID=559131 RepID=A0ABD2MN11_9CUCU